MLQSRQCASPCQLPSLQAQLTKTCSPTQSDAIVSSTPSSCEQTAQTATHIASVRTDIPISALSSWEARSRLQLRMISRRNCMQQSEASSLLRPTRRARQRAETFCRRPVGRDVLYCRKRMGHPRKFRKVQQSIRCTETMASEDTCYLSLHIHACIYKLVLPHNAHDCADYPVQSC